ncbi:ABC transporter ATP-binding protein [Dongia deserti]|uniref:ABC transporter ATP-binding protein n=1 Tax=Dongia deserti TaxID=2268030 RepID=UPI000E64AEC8|nr:ABC transporter ATP-binding protein [Dongia deserti]
MKMDTPLPAVRLMDLHKRYGDFAAVDGVSLDVRKGEFLTFLGSSGSGKTTTLNMIAGFDDPTSGQILLNGGAVTGLPPQKRNIGMVFQRYTLFPHMTVAENVGFPLSVRRLSKDEVNSRVLDALRLVQLDRFAGRRPSQLSGGQQQRVALARALVYEPQLLLMDEPLGALDKKLREEIQIEIRKLHHRLGVTILYVTHDQEEALRMSDRIAVFEHGRIVQVGSGEDLYHCPATAFVAGFIGNSNFLRGSVAERRSDAAIVKLGENSAVCVPVDAVGGVGSEVRIMIRPEEIKLSHALSDAAGAVIPVTVRERIFLGDTISYEVATRDGQSVLVREDRARNQGRCVGPGTDAYMHIAINQNRVYKKY